MRTVPFKTSAGLAFLLLVACGGGGGGSDVGDSGGDGGNSVNRPSRATADYGGRRDAIEPGPLLAAWLPVQLYSARLISGDFAFNPVEPLYLDRKVDEEQESGNGQMTVTGEFTASGEEDWFYFEYENYGDASVVINGALLQENQPKVAENGFYLSYPDAVYSLYDLQFDFGGSALQLNGTVTFRETSDGWTLESDMVMKDLATGQELYLDDFRETRSFVDEQQEADAAVSTFEGALFDSLLGGVRLSTGESFRHVHDTRTGGELLNRGTLRLFEEDGSDSYATYIFLNPSFGSLQWKNSDGRMLTLRSAIFADDLPEFVRSRVRPLADAGGDVPIAFLPSDRKNADGSFSVSFAGRPLQYRWDLVSFPPGSAPALEGRLNPVVNVLAERPGYYGLKLTVDDGEFSDTEYVQMTVSSDSDEASPHRISDQDLFQVVRASELNPDDERVFVDGRVYTSSLTSGSGRLARPVAVEYETDAGMLSLGEENQMTVLDLAEKRGGFFYTSWQARAVSTQSAIEFHPAIRYLDRVSSFAFIDANLDGLDDLVTVFGAMSDYSSGPDPVRPVLHPASAVGAFEAGFVIDEGRADDVFSIMAGDLTGEGNDELIAIGSCSIGIYAATATGLARLALFDRDECASYDAERPDRNGMIRDLDNDGVPTLVLLDGLDQVRFIEVDVFGTVGRDETIAFDYLVDTEDEEFPLAETEIQQVVVMDANMDGNLDLIFANEAASSAAPEFGLLPAFTVFHQAGNDSSFTQGPSAPMAANETFLHVADVTGDERAELITGIGAVENSVWAGRVQVWTTSEAGLSPSGMVEWNGNQPEALMMDHKRILTVELNGEEGKEILVGGRTGGDVTMLDIASDGTIENETVIMMARRDNGFVPAFDFDSPTVGTLDFDQDGNDDLFLLSENSLYWLPRLEKFDAGAASVKEMMKREKIHDSIPGMMDQLEMTSRYLLLREMIELNVLHSQ